MGLVKADAYGHGQIPVARFLQQHGCTELGCAHVNEGLALRRAGIRLPILLLSGFLSGELPAILRHRLTLTLSSLDDLRAVERAARRARTRALVQVKIDTGMGRLGVLPPDAAPLLQAVRQSPHVQWTGTYTHFACADSDPRMTRHQWTLFCSLLPPGLVGHACNSAGMLAFPSAHGTCVRPGIALYGISPVPRFQQQLRPVLSWKARITCLKTLPAGSTVSYGATFRAPRRTTIAVVSVGYGDGLFRSLSNRGSVLVGGRHCPILGRVTMDQIMIDVTGRPNVRKGTVVTLIGRQAGQQILASDMAAQAGTIAYEVWCHITDRVPRVYLPST
jgi:alanine racemase